MAGGRSVMPSLRSLALTEVGLELVLRMTCISRTASKGIDSTRASLSLTHTACDDNAPRRYTPRWPTSRSAVLYIVAFCLRVSWLLCLGTRRWHS